MPSGKSNTSGLAEGFGDEPAAVGLPDHRWVEAFLDGGPDGERRREVVTVDGEVRSVAGAEFVDVGEKVIGGVPGEDVGQAGLHPDADERQPARRLPLLLDCELLVAEFHAREFVGLVRVPVREAHRHVEIVGTTGEGAVEDRHDEPRVDGVHHVRDPVRADQFGDVVGGRRVHVGRGEPRVTYRVGGLRCPVFCVVADHDPFEEVTPRRDRTERRADTARTHQQDPHALDRTLSNCGFRRVSGR
jgi:hypothetical protein